MKIEVLIMGLLFFLILPELTRAVCDFSDQTYVYKSAVFYVNNARKIRVTVYNSMGDSFLRCFTAWIKIGENYINLDGLPYSPSNWQQAWASTAPYCYSSGYRVASVSSPSTSVDYDLTSYVTDGYTGEVEVRVSSSCYEIVQDPCFCWTAEVKVTETYQQTPCNTIVTLAVSPTTIYQGDTIKISGRVTASVSPPIDPKVYFYLDDSFIGTTYSDSYGYYSYSYKTLSSISTGTHTIKAVSKIDYCSEGFATTSFNVVAPQYCYFDIYVKDKYGNPLAADIYIDGDYLSSNSHEIAKVQAGTHVVLASKSGYYSDSKSVSCSCGETKKVDLVLAPVQVCSPGEIRNRYCVCSTQVGYEKCKGDGSGWESVIENCPSGYICSNGYCSLEKDGWYDTGRERCNLAGLECGYGTKEKEQEYKDYTCFGVTCTYTVTQRRWIGIDTCYQECASGYTCQAGYCVKVATTTTSTSTTTTTSTSTTTTSTTLPACTPRYLDEYRCYGNWVQRKYIYSDCSTGWINWEYCSYDCLDGSCFIEPKKPFKISLSVTTPSNAFVGDSITASVKITNSGDISGYVNLDAYVCKIGSYCHLMTCDDDSTVYVHAKTTKTLTCSARVQEAGEYEVKVSFTSYNEGGVVYSGIFLVEKIPEKCVAKFLDEFKCDGNWKLQLYRYSDCSKTWKYVEYCSNGCINGSCISRPTTTTTTTLPSVEEKVEREEKIPITGLTVLITSNLLFFALLILLLFIIALVIIWLWKSGKLKRKQEPEWFGEDC